MRNVQSSVTETGLGLASKTFNREDFCVTLKFGRLCRLRALRKRSYSTKSDEKLIFVSVLVLGVTDKWYEIVV